MKWYVNGLTNLLNTYLKIPEAKITLIRHQLEKLFAYTLQLAVQERSFPITPACQLFTLLENRLIYLRNTPAQDKVGSASIYEYLIGCMIIVLKVDCDHSYYLKDFLKPINLTFNTNVTLMTLKHIELYTLKLIQDSIAPTNPAVLVANALKHCQEHDIIEFWHDLNGADYHDTGEYISATLPFIKQVYRNKLQTAIVAFITHDKDAMQADKMIFDYVNGFCGSLKLNRDYTIILEILNETIFDNLRKRQAKPHPFLFANSYPTLWENITSLIKEKAAVESAAHIFAGYQRCMALPIKGL